MGSRSAVLNILLVLVFIGWLFMWVMLPTETYKYSWTPQLLNKLNSTYFREQGTNLLLLTFPIMLIAVVSCIYLHLYSKPSSDHQSNNDNNKERQYFRSWKRPLLVMEPLGIVNAVELTFAAMFTVLLIWSLANYVYVSYGHLHMHNAGEKVWMAKFRSVFLRLGYIGNICYAFLFFPVTRLSSILPLVGLTSESSIKYHIWLGHISMALAILHSVGFVIYYAVSNQMIEMLEWSSTYVSNVAGEIATLVAIAMWATSLYKIRRKMFDVFFYTHQLYSLYIFFYLLHVGAAYTCMILPGIFLFVIDRYLRFLQSKRRARLISSRLLPCSSVELTFSKNPALTYNPTSILYVNVPSVSKLQWHPYTVVSSSNLESDKLSVVIKCVGSWSQKLEKQLSSSPDRLEISTEGPYGPSSSHFLSRDCLVMISGGSGITPMISIIRELIYKSSQPNTKVPKVILITAFKDTSDLTMLDLLLPISTTPTDISNLDFQIEAYITRENNPQENNLKGHVQTIVFKRNPKDTPISAPLGKSSWLWLGAIISSSFVMFLLLLGLVTRYSIYPVERDGKIYHYSGKIIWDMFLVCVSVFIATSVIFMWQKKKNESEGKQIQNVEMPTNPTNSPAGNLCGTEMELESLPQQSIVQATKVHYGARPDLKRILFDCKASDVGVVVCGPKSMRHEVAKICASGLAQNLHFESISFNW
ncbi:ferric reduction oxidase 4-like isoform X1 [Lycium ferocissimum]|uniref:ferric reduction oxidase 4-like isoform X1 n=1 Tax=Lycium ferocissimum TaxID=112874 RepID=UPI002814EE39|nr:ferric reduction oxidase 4-like isoform X1 [Lycium ferocissimum]